MNTQVQIQAIYQYPDDLLAGLRGLKEAGIEIMAVHTPVANHEIAAFMKEKPSPIRFFTLFGGTLGVLTGFGLSIYTAWQWKFIVGGKPPIAPAPYVIEGFEFCILFSVLFNLAGFLLLTRLPRRKLPAYYDPRVSEDRFSVLVSCTTAQCGKINKLLREAGAEEVNALN
jgi:hypothetical protein